MREWAMFCTELARAEEVMARAATPADPLDRAEGYRYFTRQLRMGLDLALEFADPQFPELVDAQSKTLGDGGNTPDCVYLHAMIDGRTTYRIHGTRGGAPLIEIGVYAGKIGMHEQSRRVDAISEADLLVDATGRIEVCIGQVPGAVNGLKSDADARYVFIRQYAHDWSVTERAALRIEAIGAPATRPPLTEVDLRAGLERAARFVHDSALAWAQVVDGMRMLPANELVPIEPEQDMTMPAGHRFAAGHFSLDDGEELLVELDPVDVPYWGITLTNYWFEPLDYGGTGSHLNNVTARRGPDGTFRVVVAGHEPGAANWLDTRGHHTGTVLFRWSRTDEPLPQLRTTVTRNITT